MQDSSIKQKDLSSRDVTVCDVSSSKVKRRYLMMVRAGESSLHPGWLEGKAERNWDLLVHGFSPKTPYVEGEGIENLRAIGEEIAGPKFRAIYSLYQKRKIYFQSYDYVCFADDDLAANVETINAIFVIADFFGLDLAQPALTHDSHMACWGITMENKSFLLRYTNFVEVMVPVFSRTFLERCASTFNENISGYGLDLLWSSWVDSPLKMGILDVCPVKHTRPNRTGSLYQTLSHLGANPDQELIALVNKYNLVPANDQVSGRVILPQARIWGGILHNQKRISVAEGQGSTLLKAVINGLPPEIEKNPRDVVNIIHPILQQMAF